MAITVATAGPRCDTPASSLKPRVVVRSRSTMGGAPSPGNSARSVAVPITSGKAIEAAAAVALKCAATVCWPGRVGAVEPQQLGILVDVHPF